MPDATVVPRGGGEVVGDAPDRRVEILGDDDALHVTWSRFGPRRDGADLHVHRRHSDLFYVLAGELTARLGAAGEEVPVPAGTLARVPPLVVHGFRNARDAELRYLNLHAPGQGFAAYMRAMRDGRVHPFDQEPPPQEGARPAAEAVIGGTPLVADGPGGRAALLADVPEIAIADTRRQPCSPPSSPHRHRDHLQAFYVLEGELVLTAGDRELRAGAGAWVQVPAGVPHTDPVAGAGPVRFLDVHAPAAGFGDFLRALARGGDEAAAAARAGFDREPAPALSPSPGRGPGRSPRRS